MNLEELGKKVKKLGQDTMTEVQKLNEIRQLNSRINDQKKQMTSVYTAIGQKLYEMYKEETMEGFEAEFRELEERNAAIGIFQDQIRDIKGVRVCPNCNVEVSVNERFCSSCGHKLPEILKIEKQEDGTEVIESTDAEIIDAEETGSDSTGEKPEEHDEMAGNAETAEDAEDAETAEESVESLENAVESEKAAEEDEATEEFGQPQEAEEQRKPEEAEGSEKILEDAAESGETAGESGNNLEDAEKSEEAETTEDTESEAGSENVETAEVAEEPEQAESREV